MTLAILDNAFRNATDDSPLPVKFHINLGERCNVRCRHCITDAPAKTASGTAQVMTEDVIQRIPLENAIYVGLTHAGEPMIQPGFDALLDRVPKTAVVHLLSNGMALTPEKFESVMSRGVKSISISLDGMSAATNDALRVGVKVDVVLARLREYAGRVRLGISWVCTRENLGEIPALIDFVAENKLDYVKLEEMFAHDEFVVERFALDRAVAKAKQQAKQLGVVLVDHTRERMVWRCNPREENPDDVANATVINACRLPWEQACIEPNGDVRPVTFHHPIVGNVLSEEMSVIWNRAVEPRRQIRAIRPCGAGPTTCS
jgi:cyclomaltodextrinase / maltogenic alpha-amylase / neopullulanase